MINKDSKYKVFKVVAAIVIAFIISIFVSTISRAEVDVSIGDYDGPVKTLRYNRSGTGIMLTYWGTSTNMPRSNYGLTGMQPQYYDPSISGQIYYSLDENNSKMREVRLEKSRYDLSTTEWKGTIENGLIYCAKLGGWVRYGHTDFHTIHYLTPVTIQLGLNGTYNSGIAEGNTLYNKIVEMAGELHEWTTEDGSELSPDSQAYNRHDQWRDGTFSYDGWSLGNPVINRDPSEDGSWPYNGPRAWGAWYSFRETRGGFDLAAETDEARIVQDYVNNTMRNVLEGLNGTRNGSNPSDDDTLDDAEHGGQDYVAETMYGPLIYVQHHSSIPDETDDGDGYEFAEETTYNSEAEGLSDVDLKKAYVFTVMENAYHYDEVNGVFIANEEPAESYVDNQPNLRIASKYCANDIQTAYWWILDEEGNINLKDVHEGGHVTELGHELYLRAGEYVDFVRSHDLSNYEQYVNLDGSVATMRYDRDTDTYYVGPFTIDYPYYENNPDLTYLKSLQLNTNSGHILTYSENQKDFRIITIDGTTTRDSNGLQTEYPAPGSSFMVAFNASDAGNPTSCNVSAQCEFLAISEIDTQAVLSVIDGYRYKYEPMVDIVLGYYPVTYYYSGDYWNTQHDWVDGDPDDDSTPDVDESTPGHWNPGWSYDEISSTYYIYFVQPFFKMEDTSSIVVPAQNLTLTQNGQRVYRTVIKTATTPIPKPEQEYITVSGMKTWADNYNESNLRPKSITVNLYRDGTLIATKVTSEENDWKYNFGQYPKYKYEGREDNVILDEDGNRIEYRYTVEEHVDGYITKTIGYDIVNTINWKQEYIDKPVEKKWVDYGDWAEVRPSSVTVHLDRICYDGRVEEVGSCTLSRETGWKYTFTHLPKYEEVIINGHKQYVEYKYKFREDVVDGYVTSIDGNEILNHYGTIPLFIELGGYVWVDEEGGKQDVPNGVCDNVDDELNHAESRVKNVTVRVYRKDGGDMPNGEKFLETKTDENGVYRFEGLNAVYTYRIEFDYNGEYYEATYYSNSSTWGTDAWPVNSNALENQNERTNLNDKFAQIGSYSSNYPAGYPENTVKNSPTFTREDLLTNDIIDAHGNLTDNANIENMIKFVNECKITSYTEDVYPIGLTDFFERIEYQKYLEYVQMAENGVTLTPAQMLEFRALIDIIESEAGRRIESLYPNAYYINLGLHPRPITDVAVNKDVEKVTLEINKQVQEYTYDNLDNLVCDDCGTEFKRNEAKKVRVGSIGVKRICPGCDSEHIHGNWLIYERISDNYYDTEYTRELYKSDYIYKSSLYGSEQEKVGATKEDELEVYVTYKITVSNQSLKIRTRIDELVDYFDDDYILDDTAKDRSYIKIIKASGEEEYYDIVFDESSKYKPETSLTEFPQKTYIRGIGEDDESIYLGSGDYAYFYVTFRVRKKKDQSTNEDWLIIDEDPVTGDVYEGKENIVELNAYSTRYEKGVEIPNVGQTNDKTPAGIVDINSTPGNFDQAALDEFNNDKLGVLENDTDKAPNIKLLLYKDDEANRLITGTIWEDKRTEDRDKAKVADGIMKDDETRINGVTVQLVELRENGTEFVWREFGSEITGVGTIGNGTGSGTKGTDNFSTNVETPIINAIFTNGSESVKLVDDYEFEASSESNRGKYAFKSFIPGKYIVRYIYGDTVRTVVPEALNDDATIEGFVDNSAKSTEKGLNIKSYNGQDYKSTTYQKGVDQNTSAEGRDENYWINSVVDGDTANNRLSYIWREKATHENGNPDEIPGKILTTVATFKADYSNNETAVPKNSTGVEIPVLAQNGYVYDITESEKYNGSDSAYPNVSDAKDIESRRKEVNMYSNTNSDDGSVGVVNKKAEILASHKAELNSTSGFYKGYYDGYADADPTYNRTQLLDYLIQGNNATEYDKGTKMTAETGLMVIEFEYDRRSTDDQSKDNKAVYKIENVNLGLEERPKAQLDLDNKVTNVKVTLANGSILFDAKQTTSNVLWTSHKGYDIEYDGNVLNKDNSSTMNDVVLERIMNGHLSNLGMIQLTMDEEIMHGATIKIDYDLTVKNVGEVDYFENLAGEEIQDRSFYYTGTPSSSAQVVTTRADEVLDYVANNLQFNKIDNSGYWEAKSNDVITNEKLVSPKLINAGRLNLYNTIISSTKLSDDLVPEVYDENNSSTTVPLALSQLITSENDTDDLTYRNIAEIVKTTNSVGRRMEYSVVGNQDPKAEPKEVDADRAEKVTILPPFGETSMYFVISIVAIISVGIIAVGIIFIKKKILK